MKIYKICQIAKNIIAYKCFGHNSITKLNWYGYASYNELRTREDLKSVKGDFINGKYINCYGYHIVMCYVIKNESNLNKNESNETEMKEDNLKRLVNKIPKHVKCCGSDKTFGQELDRIYNNNRYSPPYYTISFVTFDNSFYLTMKNDENLMKAYVLKFVDNLYA